MINNRGMFQRQAKFVFCLLATVSVSQALEMKFQPSFLELHAEGVVQRVMPGELVEVPLGDKASLEIEISAVPPRKVDIASKGDSEFVIFGAKSRLGDGGKMVASMSPETKKLDIAWTKGEMTTPPGNFDKASVVAFFTRDESDLLRPMEFAGIRPFGYTDVLEGHRPPSPGELPYFPPPPENMNYPLPPPSNAVNAPPSPQLPPNQGWVTYEDEQSTLPSLPPLTIPPPLPAKPTTPSQVVFLEPSEAKSSLREEDAETIEAKPKEQGEEGEESEKQADREKDAASESPSKSPDTQTPESSSTPESSPAPEEKPEPSSASEPEGKRRVKPTLYQMVMDQDKKQREFLQKIEEVAQQVKNIKEGGAGGQMPPLPRVPETLTFLGEATPSLFAPLLSTGAPFPASPEAPPKSADGAGGSGASESSVSVEQSTPESNATAAPDESKDDGFEVEVITSE